MPSKRRALARAGRGHLQAEVLQVVALTHSLDGVDEVLGDLEVRDERHVVVGRLWRFSTRNQTKFTVCIVCCNAPIEYSTMLYMLYRVALAGSCVWAGSPSAG